MGITFYLIGSLVALSFFTLAVIFWYYKNRDKIQQRMIGWICYHNACNKGYINPGKYEHDKEALDYAIKYKKKQSWIVVDYEHRRT